MIHPTTEESTMNTMTTSTHVTHPRALIATAILGVLVSSFAAECGAADSTEAPKAIVRYADLDISSSQGAAMLYNRIRSASEGLCAPLDARDLGSKFRAKACVQRAIEGAVAQVNRPGLSALYVAKYGVQQPAKLLTADRR
jgi:UrcA family protein